MYRLQIKNICSKISLFYVGYILYFISLFFDDLPIDVGMIGKIIKYTSYLVFLLTILEKNITRKKAIISFGIFVLFATIGLFTKDLYYCFLVIILFSSKYYNPYKILNISYYLLIFLTLITIITSLIGILPNLNTMNRNYSERYAFGFYHSNVLPMVLYYLYAYRVSIKKEKINIKEIVIWLIISVIIFSKCKSKNGFIAVLILTFGYIYYKNRSQYKMLYFFAKYSVAIISFIFLVLTLAQGMYLKSMYVINKLLTGRLGMAYHQIKTTGLHMVNLKNKSVYSESEKTFVLDSGYLYTMIRYGIFFIFIYIVLQYICARKNKYSPTFLIVILINSLVNAIDNDLFSYNMLPFWIIAVSKVDLKDFILKYTRVRFLDRRRNCCFSKKKSTK